VRIEIECLLGGEEDGEVVELSDDALFSFEIPRAACDSASRVCPEGFASTNLGNCKFASRSPPFFVEDPAFTEWPPVRDPSLSDCQGPIDWSGTRKSFLPSEAILESESLAVRATVEVSNVDDEVCVTSGDFIASVDYLDEQEEFLDFDRIVFNVPSGVEFSDNDPLIRSTEVFLYYPPAVWGTGPEVCCERIFQTTWSVNVDQCEGW